MGQPKQMLRLGEKTLLERTLDNLRAAERVNEIVVVLGAAAEELRPLAGEAKVVVNEAYADGMARSLQCGLKELDERASATFVVLADMPLMKAATLDRMVEEYLAHGPQILIPTWRGFRGNPVLLDKSVFPEIAGLQGDTGCRAIFGDHVENIRTVAVEDEGVLLDADRPKDFVTLRAVFESGALALPVLEKLRDDAPEVDVVVVGREKVATAVIRMARLLGYGVTVVDPLLTFEEMPEASAILRVMDFAKLPEAARRFCVVASMGRFDEEAIEQAVGAGIEYVALVANKARSREVLHSLGLRGVKSELLEKVRTKPGLAIGAQGAEEIGLSIVAEIVREWRAGVSRRPPHSTI